MAGVKLTPRAAARIKRQTLAAERRPRNLPPTPRARAPAPGFPPGRIARTSTGGIPAMTGISPGSASCELVHFDGTNVSILTDTVTVYNLSSSAVTGSGYIQIKWIEGYWFVDFEDCV